MGRLMFLALAVREEGDNWPHELRTLEKTSPLKQRFRTLQWTKLVGKKDPAAQRALEPGGGGRQDICGFRRARGYCLPKTNMLLP